MNTTTAFILGISAGLIVGIIVMNVMSKIGLNKNQQKAELVIKKRISKLMLLKDKQY